MDGGVSSRVRTHPAEKLSVFNFRKHLVTVIMKRSGACGGRDSDLSLSQFISPLFFFFPSMTPLFCTSLSPHLIHTYLFTCHRFLLSLISFPLSIFTFNLSFFLISSILFPFSSFSHLLFSSTSSFMPSHAFFLSILPLSLHLLILCCSPFFSKTLPFLSIHLFLPSHSHFFSFLHFSMYLLSIHASSSSPQTFFLTLSIPM